MWRINRKVSTVFASLKNPFFLETFIYSFIESLIESKLFTPDKKRDYDFRVFAHFLHDYVLFVEDKKEEFSFGRFQEYSDYRRIGEKLEESIKKNADIVYDKKFYLEYAHTEFAEGNKLAVKKYRRYQEKRSIEEDEKSKEFREQADSLRDELLATYKNEFYDVLWNNFMGQF